MQTIINAGLQDRNDHHPALVYRIMTPSVNGNDSDFKTISIGVTTATIRGVSPSFASVTWAPNRRMLGVQHDEVLPPNPLIGLPIGPAQSGQPGAGMSVAPVLGSLPPHRVPRRNGGLGSNKDCCFTIERVHIEKHADLRLHFDIGDVNMNIEHGVIEPAKIMMPADFARHLRSTVNLWSCLNW